MKPESMIRYISMMCVVGILSLLLAGCALFKKEPPEVKETGLTKISASEYPEFLDDMAYNSLTDGILGSISYLRRVPPTRTFRFGQDVYDTSHMIRSLEHFLYFIQAKPSNQELKEYIDTNYLVYRSVGGDTPGEVLFTGYYEPVLEGSLEPTPEYPFPIYARPDDLTTIDLSLFSPQFKGKKIIGRYTHNRVVPYYDRKDIEYKELLKDKAVTIAWLKDRVDLFFLHIQGSGKIDLDSGETIHVHYHTTNGRPYRSIGKLLIDQGKISRAEMSMQKIRDYLYRHPEEVGTVLYYNPSYVFFKIEEDGPLGYLEVKLTPGRSIAMDRHLFPLAGLAFIETQKPLTTDDGKIDRWTDFSRFVLYQDTGGAIRGPGRGDLFWGNGPQAEIAAGHMKHPGKLYFLILKPE
jgi:membrane-bound lytic murein transglycosylase A